METNSRFFLDFGMEVKKYEGIYSVGSFIWGATAIKMHEFEHKIMIVPAIYFSFLYKF
jgi:hypothetical protein